MEIWGHRGYPAKYPENSMASFRAALAAGADGIELDIQKSRDGKFWVIHDDELLRTCGIEGNVASLDEAGMRAVDCGGGEAVPELSELFRALAEEFVSTATAANRVAADRANRGITVNVELKDETIVPEDFAAIDGILRPWTGQFRLVISSFRHDLLTAFSRAGYRCGLLIGEEQREDGASGIRKSIVEVKPWSIHLPVQIFEELPAFPRAILMIYLWLKGIRRIYWTVNTPEQLRRVKGHAHAVISDNPPGMRGAR